MNNAHIIEQTLEHNLIKTAIAVRVLRKALTDYEAQRVKREAVGIQKAAETLHRKKVEAYQQLKRLNCTVVQVSEYLNKQLPHQDTEKPVFIEHEHRDTQGRVITTVEYLPKYDTVERLLNRKKYEERDVLPLDIYQPGKRLGETEQQTKEFEKKFREFVQGDEK